MIGTKMAQLTGEAQSESRLARPIHFRAHKLRDHMPGGSSCSGEVREALTYEKKKKKGNV